MTNKEFTEQIAAAQMGIWTGAAKIALQFDDVDLFVQHWVEQYLDEGSRPAVERMLNEEQTDFIKQTIKGINEHTGR